LRVVFLVPELRRGLLQRVRVLVAWHLGLGVHSASLGVTHVWGGILNLLRHCALVRSLGMDATLATMSGRNPYDDTNAVGLLPVIRWSERRPGDLFVLTDVLTWLADEAGGPVVAYIQNPQLIRSDFDHRRADVFVWTDSPPMAALCQKAFPGREIAIAPNVVDPAAFPFIPQAARRAGELVAFPRKGERFIDDVERCYRAAGGCYWRLERVHGLAFADFARRMRTPQAFLASSSVEGCALPPQECMAAGIAVVGRDAGGANFCMKHRETALVAETPEEAAAALVEAEDPGLREQLSRTGHDFIRRFFPDREPSGFWRDFLGGFP
jgi:glycosyltransferase involved in cell wall biosynthesis